MSDDNPNRCTWRSRMRDGSEVECSDAGMWTLDKGSRTWRPADPDDRSRRCYAHGPRSDAKPSGARRRPARPNARLQVAAGVLLGLAPEVTKALLEVTEEMSLLGFPGSGNGASSYLEAKDPVAGDAVRIAELTAWREDLRDAIGDLTNRVDALARLVKRVRNVDWAHGVKLCAENQQGREGSIQWGDPTCTELPVKADLCSACYQAERRWHMAHSKVGVDA